MCDKRFRNAPATDAFSIIEVLVATLLIAISLGSIMEMNVKSIDTLRASRQASASSQILQQRVEMFRTRPWVEVASSTGLARLMSQPTDSEPELAGAGMSESVRVFIPQDSPDGSIEGSRFFQVRRTDGADVVQVADDFTTQPTIFVEDVVTWRDHSGVHQRALGTIICATGLTRSGILGSKLGNPRH